ncbi:MAG: ATP-binding cassette domain-containing protein [Gemmatimonadales bacterium]
MTGSAPRLAADSVVRRFGARVVLDAAYVDLVPGLVTALVGVSGSGKTTLLEILVGRLRPHVGQVRWDGKRVPRPTHAALAQRGVIYAPDRGWLSTRLPVNRQLALAARVHGTDWRAAARTGGIEALLARRCATLSTGEQRLCELALARTCRPKALVLDEPFRSLDPLHREAVGRLLVSLAREGTAVLFADHDARMVLQVADRVFALEDGRTRPVADFRARPVLEWYRGWAGVDG